MFNKKAKEIKRLQSKIEFLDPAMRYAVAENSKTKLKLRECLERINKDGT